MTDDTPSSADPLSRPGLVQSLRGWIKSLKRKSDGESLREALEELVSAAPGESDSPEIASERQLLANILHVQERNVSDIMVPRADIVAVEMGLPLEDLMTLITHEGHTRYPVYRGELDEIIGMVHIKDLLLQVYQPSGYNLQALVRDLIIVAPTMPVLDLLVEMRQSRRHMAVVVDEFGGIDGLVTIEDLVEEIVGEIEDEHDELGPPQLTLKPDGSVMADGRLALEELEKYTGSLLDEESHDSVDTLGGLLFFLADRVPGRGELIRHDNGIEFEVIEADARRVKRVRIRNLPPTGHKVDN